MKSVLVLTCLIASAVALPAPAADQGTGVRMYKCIDQAGKVYYSDKLNPDCGQGSELNRQGVVMKKKEVGKPGQPAKAEPAKTDAVPLAPKYTREQERRDRALMATYTSEEEIDAARDRSLAIPEQGMKGTQAKIDKANLQLSELKKQADTLASQKKPLPPNLLEDVNHIQKQISAFEAEHAQRKAQMDSIRTKFDADKQRFRELKGVGQATK
jgi:hypothetical protein